MLYDTFKNVSISTKRGMPHSKAYSELTNESQE